LKKKNKTKKQKFTALENQQTRKIYDDSSKFGIFLKSGTPQEPHLLPINLSTGFGF